MKCKNKRKIVHSFLLQKSIPWYGYISLLNHSLVRKNLGFQLLATKKSGCNFHICIFVNISLHFFGLNAQEL